MTDAVIQALPAPVYTSRRLLGLEIELDAMHAPFHTPVIPNGWADKHDGSLENGREYVLEPPLPVVEAKVAVDQFCAAVTQAKMHVAMSGGYHIHVQIHDYGVADAARLAQLYWRYQGCIDLLCGQSRRSVPTPNHYCSPYDLRPTEDLLTETFQLYAPARDRVSAKLTRQRMVLNFAMMRCANPLERTVEFRQPSPSKKAINIYGWACFATALTEFAVLRPVMAVKYINAQPNWRNFMALCQRMERELGAVDLAKWVAWRRSYLYDVPASLKLSKLYHSLIGRSHGLFHVARVLDINLGVAKKLVEAEVAKHHLVNAGMGRYRVTYDSVAPLDLKAILAIWAAKEQPAVAEAVPVASGAVTPPQSRAA